MLVAYRTKDRAVFLYGFAKSERENIAHDELDELRKIAAGWLQESAKGIARAIEDGSLEEVDDGEKGGSKPVG